MTSVKHCTYKGRITCGLRHVLFKLGSFYDDIRMHIVT